jgi:hypothetical protein
MCSVEPGDEAAAAAAAAAAAGGGGGFKAPAWAQGINEHQTALLQKKSWGDQTPIGVVLDAYANAEKALGSEKIALPKGDADQQGWDALFKVVGRPDAPDKYTLKLPDNFDKDFVGGFKEAAHKAGLGDKQANALAAWFQDHGVKVANERNEGLQVRMEQELDALKTAQGAKYDEFTKVGNAAATALKLTPEKIDKLEQVLGTRETLEMLYNIGLGMKEGQFTGGGGGGGGSDGAMTPQQAITRIGELRRDQEWQKKYSSGDMAARNLWGQLHRWAYPD